MCGIAGIWNLQKTAVDERDLVRMARVMAHRGPDDEGTYVDGPVGLAFRRLSIIDLSAAGHQPMESADGNAVIVFNGEVYNFPELADELREKGFLFRSKTDTEVALNAYLAYGPQCVARLNGMFGFAIFDRRTKTLFCARDRFGMKPVYYLKTGGRFLFASELKSILAVRGVTPRLNPAALGEYFTFQNNFGDATLFQNVHMLPPAHTLTITHDGSMRIDRYWEPDFASNGVTDEQEAIEAIRDILQRSITRHLIADVPVGSHLSGGLDSASLVAMARRHVRDFKTFTAGFSTDQPSEDNISFDERGDAELVARYAHTQHYSVLIQHTDVPKVMPNVIWHTEDLRVGNSYPSYYVNELASRFVKVAWCGTGGDELFGGYVWRYQNIRDAHAHDDFHKKYYGYWTRLLDEEERKSLFRPGIWQRMREHDPYESYRAVIDRAAALHPIDRALYFEIRTFLHGLLNVEDKMSAAHGLELRVPLLDQELVDYVLGLPHDWKANHTTGKLIFRKAIESFVPRPILQKRKQGFAAPEVIWFRTHLLPYIRETLLGNGALNREFMQPQTIERFLHEHVSGIKNHRLLLWSLLSFEWWLRIFMDGKLEKYNDAFSSQQS